MEMDLEVPLSISQVEAANRLHQQLSEWKITDSALHALHVRFPGFDIESSLLKVAAVNQLYGTKVFAVVRMAEHIKDVMPREGKIAEVDFVEKLATLPEMKRKYVSFASKFAHFFIDLERFPIYDFYAVKMVAYHLGSQGLIRDKEHPYIAFVTNFNHLKQAAGLVCTTRELDRYLWLAGLYGEWCRNSASQINAEVAEMFKTPSLEINTELAILSSGK